MVAVDIGAGTLALAAELGAAATVDASAGDAAEAVREATGGGAHVSLDALGAPATCAASVRGLRRRGRHVQVGLLLGDHAAPPVPMAEVIAWELEILGSHGMPAHRYGAMLEMVRSGRLDPARLIGARIALEEAPAALMAMDAHQGVGATVVTRV